MGVLQNFQKFRSGTKHAVPVAWVLWPRTYRTYTSSRYGYECRTELVEVRGTGMKVLQKFQKFRVLWHSRTELPEVPGRYKHAVPVPQVFGAPAYRTSRSSGYGYVVSYITDVLCRVLPSVNTPGMVLCVPYRQNENRTFGYGYECRTELTDVSGTDRVVQNSPKSRVRVIPR